MKLSKAVKRKWLEALRSGEYKQGDTYLANEGKYCCLGVLGCVLDKRIRRFQRWLHVDIIPRQKQETLAEMNDGFGQPVRSFKYIAKWIEANL